MELPPQDDLPADEVGDNTDLTEQQIIAAIRHPQLTRIIAKHGLFQYAQEKILMAEPVPTRVERRHGEDSVYLIQVRQNGTGLSAITILVHTKEFDDKEMQQMLLDAAKIVNESRIAARRKALSDSRTPIRSVQSTNDECFPGDVEFLEAVLMDKFQFRRLASRNMQVDIDPTVKLTGDTSKMR